MTSRAVRFATGCYEALMRLYPREFRKRHAAEMACVFNESCEAEWSACGNRGLLMLAIPTLHDLVVSAAVERMSAFVTELRWDKQMLSRTPGFRAAAAIVFTICFAVVGMLGSGAMSRITPWQRWLFFAEACLNVGALWAASVLLAKPAWTWRNYASSIFFEKLRAFRHLSGVALRLLMTLAALSMIAALRSSARGYTPGPMPPLWQCAIFPVLLLLLVVLFFLLDPLLSPNRREDGPGQLRMD